MSSDDKLIVVGLLCVGLLVLFVLSTPLWATDEVGARRILESNGYTVQHVGGYAWFACSNTDTFQTKFEAISPNGRNVRGAVCRGILFKNATIRFE